MRRVLIFSILLSFSPAFAKKFVSSYVSFDLLNNWQCHPEGTDWICANKFNRKKASEAMIILTAKQKGPSDSLALYLKHVKTSRQVKSRRKGEASTPSKVFHAKQRVLNGHMWVDGFQGGSEVPNYYTRYLVTTKGSLGILVTYSAHKKHYKQYASDFAKSINSLRVFKAPADFSVGRGGDVGVGSTQDYIQGIIDAEKELGLDDEMYGEGEGESLLKNPKVLFLLLLLLLALLVYFLRKRRKKLSRKSSREKHRGGKGSSSRHRRREHHSSSRHRK